MITREACFGALRATATELNGNWYWGGGFAHTEAEALDIVETCLRLDVPVTDVLTGAAFLRLVRIVDDLRERVA